MFISVLDRTHFIRNININRDISGYRNRTINRNINRDGLIIIIGKIIYYYKLQYVFINDKNIYNKHF